MQVSLENYLQINFDKGDGLVPAIVQHAYNGEVLMQGYMNQEALLATLTQAQAYFYSRSKQRLWRKGETSNHVLHVQSIHTDCDQDSLLVMALPAGPTCHLERRSCFASQRASPLLVQLMDTIQARQQEANPNSYTVQLLQQGVARVAQKVGEEGVEVALAAVSGDNSQLLNESADLLYHLLVLLAARDVHLNEVLLTLAKRQSAA